MNLTVKMSLGRISLSWSRALVLVFFCGVLHAQSSVPPPNSGPLSGATVTFTFDWASIQPHHFVIAVGSVTTSQTSTGERAMRVWARAVAIDERPPL